jgi:hypothetical protein
MSPNNGAIKGAIMSTILSTVLSFRAKRGICFCLAVALSLFLTPSLYAQQSTCLDCHSTFDGNLKITAAQFGEDIHAQKGLTCASCHGGDPTSPDNAMDPRKGFKGHIARNKIPGLCASCHSNGEYMRQYNPSLRTDQFAQYQTSVHGKKLAAGDTHVAVCIDCHGVHGIRAISDPRATVYPTNVAQTCARCHADREYMKPYGIPTNQFAGYSGSVHHDALAVRGDLTAPTCTTCHGNHGAAPPGVASVENVCSTCHALQAQLYDTSPHKKAFASAGMAGCVTCHSNHAIHKPSDSMIGTGPQAVCTNCHTQGDGGLALAASVHQEFGGVQEQIQRSDQILTRAASDGMEVSQAQMDLNEARDRLTKARVTMHSFNQKKIDEDVNAAKIVSAKTYQAGLQAMKERDYRRMGLGISLITIAMMLLGLKLYISDIEKK